jgi:hypothetical protein
MFIHTAKRQHVGNTEYMNRVTPYSQVHFHVIEEKLTVCVLSDSQHTASSHVS